MKRQWRFVCELPDGTRKVLFITTLTEPGARQLVEYLHPSLRIIRVTPFPPETHWYEVAA